MPDTASFHIKVPLDKLLITRTVLEGMGIALDPVQSMLHLPDNSLQYSIFTGLDGQYAVNRINQHLQEEGSPHRIDRQFTRMSPPARRDLLELATANICWTTDEPPNIESVDDEALQAFLGQHPTIVQTSPRT